MKFSVKTTDGQVTSIMILLIIEMTGKSALTKTISSLNTEATNQSPEKDIYVNHGILKPHTDILTHHRTSQAEDLRKITVETQMQVETLSGVTLMILKKDGTTVTQRPMTNLINKINKMITHALMNTYSQTDVFQVKTCRLLRISASKIA